MKKPHEILLSLVLTENSYNLVETENTFIFQVARDSHKIQIGQAVEKAFDVRVLSVNTCIQSSKKKAIRGRQGQKTVIRGKKKAFVKVHEDDTGKIPLI